MSIRLFVALRPPAAVREQLLGTMRGIPGARWQADEQLHLTLRFIGAVDERTADAVAAVLGQVHAAAPTVRIAGTGRFDGRSAAQALWAGVQPHDALQQLHRKVDAACARAGLEPERRAYLPHITLARFAARSGRAPEITDWLADTAALASTPFTCGHLILYEGELGRDGAAYSPLERWPLAVPG
ncbi:RNA 2',3'-cyclic phosphodiesterase [Sphingomonas sp.]|uniref:RNA 2',3'-cyclic phosphodiesterase n=1 Tax=Sphingomonas sp. TaxID=28214 RepID=UPI003CC663B5